MTSRATGLGLLTLLTTLFAAGSGTAQELPGPADDRIAVHGDWVIEVIRDGEVVIRTAFSNDLTGQGAGLLSEALAGERVFATWDMDAVDSNFAGTEPLCADPGGAAGFCIMRQSQGTVSASSTAEGLELIGTNTVTQDGAINRVRTISRGCVGTLAPADCPLVGPDVSGGEFTQRILDTPIPVQSGDRIEVTVLISFS